MTKELTAFAKLFIEKNWFQRVSDNSLLAINFNLNFEGNTDQRNLIYLPVKPGDTFLK